MPGVLIGQSLAREYMSQVSTASRALNFRSHAIRVWLLSHGAFDEIVERRPAAAGIEFCSGGKKWLLASSAHVRSFLVEVVVLPREGCFGPFMNDDVFFFGGECVQSHSVHSVHCSVFV